MFERVLVANRGEIAVRIIAACKDVGAETIAVHSEVDENAKHVRLADEAYEIGPGRAADSYLDQETIIEVAEANEVDAIHPGYGFLAENAEFAARVEDHKALTWVGPPSEAMARLGEKTQARTLMDDANVPIVPGTTDPITDPETVRDFGDQHGYPIVIKAEGGGGGRGMKVIRNSEEVTDQLESAMREGEAYFDNDAVYVEKYLADPKHIEVQILADQHGNVRHVGERECSLQRRHQKVVEEGPSPSLTEARREEIYAAARRGAREAGYTNAGTVEFLVEDDQFYFLEVNTRIQVEHPVSEELTDIDIVKWQLRVAAGEELSFEQDDVQIEGHAIEYRINAEDPANEFAPAEGTVSMYDPPGTIGVRVDDALKHGDEVSGDYDSLVGKIIVWGSTREECLARSRRAFDQFELAGIHTTIPFHRYILSDEKFVAGTYTTNHIDESIDPGTLSEAVERWSTHEDEPEPTHNTLDVVLDGKEYTVEIVGGEAGPIGSVGTSRSSNPERSRPVQAEQQQDVGGSGAVDPTDENVITTGIDGSVFSVAVGEGDEVSAGDELCTIEAMKMENSISSPRDGVVVKLFVEKSDKVETGDPVARLEE